MTLCVEKKQDLRSLLKARRGAISVERRKEAAQMLVASFLPSLNSYHAILSFHALSEEIDTLPLNAHLAKEKRLLLPKISGDSLLIYQVDDPLKELEQNAWHLWEPNPLLCRRVELEQIDCILVPGLGFDLQKHRIGYGKGHYDRLLGQIDHTRLKKVGLGFKEQLVEEGLPCVTHDIALDEVLLI